MSPMRVIRQVMHRLALSLALAVPMAAAAPGAQTVPIADTPATQDRLPRASVDLDGIRVLPDLVYAEQPGFRPLRLDLYLPPGQEGVRRPLLIFVHGGGWTTGTQRTTAHFADFPGVLAGLARRGFVVASLEYRLSGEAPFPAAADDVAQARTWLLSQAGHWGVDPGRVALWGASAGAHLAALAALRCPPSTPDCAQAFVGWYGPYDIAVMLDGLRGAAAHTAAMSPQERAESEGGLAFFGCTADACSTDLELASPIAWVDSDDPPTLLLHGSADSLVPMAQSVALRDRLEAAGVPVTLERIDGVGHGWTGADPAATAAASRQALAVTTDWLVRVLAPVAGPASGTCSGECEE